MNQLDVCTVIFDDELSPGQQRSLEVEFGGEAAGIKVLDRTALILDIFAQHARTREGQLQVSTAPLPNLWAAFQSGVEQKAIDPSDLLDRAGVPRPVMECPLVATCLC